MHPGGEPGAQGRQVKAGFGVKAGPATAQPRGSRLCGRSAARIPRAAIASPAAAASSYLLVSSEEYRSGKTWRQRWKKRTCRSRRKSSRSPSPLPTSFSSSVAAMLLRKRHSPRPGSSWREARSRGGRRSHRCLVGATVGAAHRGPPKGSAEQALRLSSPSVGQSFLFRPSVLETLLASRKISS